MGYVIPRGQDNMSLSRVTGALATLVVVGTVLGALASLLTATMVGQNALPSRAVFVIVFILLLIATLAGVRSRRWLESAGYW
jgi:ABC-type nitrate/sulfonate/bicarbonate transport system permease component